MRNGRLAPQSVCELLTDAIIISICTYNSVAHRCSGGDARRTRHDFANGSHGNCFCFVRPLCGSVRLSAINLDVNGECRVYFITFRLSHSRSTRRFAYLLHSERRHQLAHLRAWMVYIGMQFWKTLVPCMQITTAAHEAARANIWMNYRMDVIKSNSQLELYAVFAWEMFGLTSLCNLHTMHHALLLCGHITGIVCGFSTTGRT